MLTSPVGLRSEKGCVGDAQQKVKSTDPTSRQRGRLTVTGQFVRGQQYTLLLLGCRIIVANNVLPS
jgi:hypothetical protein